MPPHDPYNDRMSRSGAQRPIIGITVDNKDNAAASGKYESATAYSLAVARAGGLPVLLPQASQLIEDYLDCCAGFVLTGGADPHMEAFGQVTHAQAKVMDRGRQAFESALLSALEKRAKTPVLGVCLGMQMMALCAGGKLHQHLPEVIADAAAHQRNNRHGVILAVRDSVLRDASAKAAAIRKCTVASWHHQAVADPGRLRTVAKAPDGVIEAIDDPRKFFYLGVQWHPERGGDGPFNQGLVDRLVAACRAAPRRPQRGPRPARSTGHAR